MGRGTLRGVFVSWLGLIALQALSTAGGSGRLTELVRDVDAVLQRALDPSIPAIGDRRNGPVTYDSSTSATPPGKTASQYLDAAGRQQRAGLDVD